VLYAPGLTRLKDIRQVVASVDRPVNVLALAKTPDVPVLAEAGVSRISVGGAFAFAAIGALADAAKEFRERGRYGFLAGARTGRDAVRDTFAA
jgi:2-methylisocitrate lyase-like PEP mutase family enzyme